MQLSIYIVRRLSYLGSCIVPRVSHHVRDHPGPARQPRLPDRRRPGGSVNRRRGHRTARSRSPDISSNTLAYLSALLVGDLGDSWRTGNPVTVDIGARWPATIELASASLLLAILWSVPLGIVSALRRRSFSDRVANFLSGLGVSIPEFWLALILLLVFFGALGVAPPPLGRTLGDIPAKVTGFYLIDAVVAADWGAFRAAAAQLILPATTLAFVIGAPLLRVTRGFMRETMASPHIRSARALGVPKRSIIFRHALPNVLLPVSTMLAMMYGYLLGGTVLVEIVFAWPGIGKYAVDSINSSDFAPVLAAVLLSALSYLFVYLVIDVVHFVVDPRTRT